MPDAPVVEYSDQRTIHYQFEVDVATIVTQQQAILAQLHILQEQMADLASLVSSLVPPSSGVVP